MSQKIELISAILEAFEDGIYVMNQDLRVEYMNSAMMADFGDGVGKKCHELLNQTEDKCPWCRSDEVFQGKTLRREIYVPLVDKTYYLKEIPFEYADKTLSKLSIYRDITARKKQEEMLWASESEFKTLFEHIATGVFISSKEGKFLNANQALLDMLGYDSKEEFLSIDLPTDLYVRPEDRRTFQEMMERDGRVIDYEVEFKRKDGSTIPILLTGHARYDHQGKVIGYEGLNVDLTQRKLMEKELKEAYDFMNKIVQSSPNSTMATDLKGNIIIWNRAAEETLGYKAGEVIGKMNIDKIYPEDMARKVMQMLRSNEYGGAGRLKAYPMVYVRRDGEVVEGTLSAAIIYDASGTEIASVGSFVDLRERLEMERALRRTQEQLLQSEKLAAMGRLTSQIAHELNNPLYGIMNTLELLKTEVSPQSKRRKILEMALSETVRLSELLRKMLSFSKPDQEQRQPVDINTVIDEILLLHEKQLRENDIHIATTFSDGLGRVNASKDQLRQVFLNMVANARDAMAGGGTLTVTTSGDGEKVIIEVTDTGTGIKEEYMDKIFDSFFTTKGEVKGVGLGLSVCYGFIKDHGGDIVVKSEVGTGTTFVITLPVFSDNPMVK
ncbi:MAG: PAS domain S-box protein [Deltaproteobacteria bacterium]|jgi:two-component system NtrC family sensor kinase|nr:PAS domain S-box protein [Deltaproteobacteria bacterium]